MTREAMREERKVVTALFADIVGSTQITEKLDPEDAREVLGAAVRSMIEAAEWFGGTVKDLAGDGVLVLFGAPVAHEDDAERAVRAALRIVKDVCGLTDDPADSSSSSGLSVRVGIESGLVALGPIGGGARVEYGATGDALNVAARLQSHAEPGGILVGATTQRMIGPLFVWSEVRRLELKGKSETVSAFEVLGASGPAYRRRDMEALGAPIVGREEELSRALGIARRTLAGLGGLLLVVGEPGIGKSRLVEEVRQKEASSGARWLEGRCVSFGRSTPYLPLAEVILQALEIEPDEPNLSAALSAHLAALVPDEIDDVSPYLAALLGVEGQERTQLSPEMLRFRTLEAMRILFARLADSVPLFIAVEDLHWADPSSLRAIEQLVPIAQHAPVLFVLTSRDPGGATERLWKIAKMLPAQARGVVSLKPLSFGTDENLLDALLGDDTLPPELRGRILGTAGGNPFFIQELVRSLIHSGILTREGRMWMLARADITVVLPTTIEKVILARLDGLEPDLRDVMTAASVLGRRVSIPLLEQVMGTDPRPVLEALQRLNLLEDGGHPEELLFSHALIQEVAYDTLLKRRRRELHARAAVAIGELWPDRAEENLTVLARHHRAAGDLEEASRCYLQAAARAERLHASEEALDQLSSALELKAELGRSIQNRDVAELLLARARGRARTGDVTGAKDDLQTILEGAPAADLLMRAHNELGSLLAGAADYREAVPHLQAALEAAIALSDHVAEVSALSRLSLVHANRLDFVAGLEYGEQAMRLAESLGDDRAGALAMAMDSLKQVALQIGDFDTLEELVGRLSEIHRRNDDLWFLQFALFEIGYADLARARTDDAFTNLDEALSINRRIGDRGNEPLHMAALALAHRNRGEYSSALVLGREAFELARDLGHGEWTASSAEQLAGTLLQLGALSEASDLLDVGIDAADRSAADLHLVRCLGLNAWASYRLGQKDRAVGFADRATSILARVRVLPPRAFVFGHAAYFGAARVRIKQGLLDAAASLLHPVVAACEACGWSEGIVEGWLALGALALERGDLAGATTAAQHALDEAVRAGLPTAWQGHAALALAQRAAGAENAAIEHTRQAQDLVAGLMASIEDPAIRDAFAESTEEMLSAEGGAG